MYTARFVSAYGSVRFRYIERGKITNMINKFIHIFLAFMIVATTFVPTIGFAQEGLQDVERKLLMLTQEENVEGATELLAEVDQRDEERSSEVADDGKPARVVVVDVKADGSDLVVAVAWNPEIEQSPSARITVQNGQEKIVGEIEVRPQLEETAVISLPGVLERVHEQGLQYQIIIEDGEGQELTRYPYHVMIVCEDEENCTYELLGGVFTEAILITEEMDKALDEIEAERPEDILATLVERYPHLQGDAYALGLQISLQKRTDAKRRSAKSLCICWWTAVVNRSPNSSSFFNVAVSPSVHKAGWNGPGAAHYFAAKSTGGSTTHSASGTTKLTMKMRCWGFIGWTYKWIKIRILWWTIYIQIPVPIFGYCEPQCDGKVTQNVKYVARTKAQSINSAFGYAWDRAHYSVNGTMASGFPEYTFSWAGPNMNDADSSIQSASMTTSQPSTAELNTYGIVGVWAFGQPQQSQAYAKVVNGFSMSAKAYAPCTIPQTVSSWMLGAYPSHSTYLWLDSWFSYVDWFLP